ncbi:3'-5' exonuclease [Desmonostoc muscorum LEGE 12446]|uniref:3'-5' exonuclease n=1 Tax=Desmonostoc muscorum LEGE 12446 TaxID=1828758 RepID=A0A8J6ZQA8_DESMC|nr:3'-5' exonuclease [Desmonostoc muscorum]MCF2149794.1 3'-5' exonuclease [Desmonostoc muscorum LEGE 12446]
MLTKILPAFNEKAYGADRYQAMIEAQQIIASSSTFLDTETTGLSNAYLVEICILSHHGSSLINTLIKPPIPIPEETTRIHGITNEMVANAPEFPGIYPRLKQILEGQSVCIYNASFDIGIIDNCCDYYKLPRIEIKADCAMNLYADYYGEWSRYWGNNKWQKLPGGGEHRAYSDAKACYKLVHAMAQPESCPYVTPSRIFPPKQLFIHWIPWLSLTLQVERKYGSRKLKEWSIKKPVFSLSPLAKNETDAEIFQQFSF